MRRLLIFALLMFAIPAGAATFYVSNSGSDSNNGTSTSTPWQTIAHVNAQTFAAGDSILFQDGGTWREELLPPSSGTSGSPITFGSYGTGAQPIINGANVVTGTWTTYTQSPGPVLQDSFGNGGTAGTQALGATSKAYIASAFTPTTSYTAVQFAVNMKKNIGSPFTNPVNAYIYSNKTSGCNGVITACPGTLIATATATIQPTLTTSYALYDFAFMGVALTGGTQYWLELYTPTDASNYASWSAYTGATGVLGLSSPDGATWTAYATGYQPYILTYTESPSISAYQIALTTQPYVVIVSGTEANPVSGTNLLFNNGDWYWASNVLYLKEASSPGTGTVQASARSYCISGTVGYITISNLECEYSSGSGMVETGSAWTISGNTIQTLGGLTTHDSGIAVNGGTGTIVQGNTITQINDDGVTTIGTGTVIQNNLISYTWNGKIVHSGGDGRGINLASTSAIAKYNNLQNNFIGIFDSGATNSIIEYNVVSNSMSNDIDHSNGTAGSPALIYGNTIIHDPYWTSGHGVVCETSGDGCFIENNNIYETFTGANAGVEGIAIDSASYTNIATDYNNIFIASGSTANIGDLVATQYSTLSAWQTALNGTSYAGKDAHSISADPLFVNYSGGNYALGGGSPAIGAGANLGSPYNIGLLPASTWPANVILGAQAPAWNIGAYLTPGGINPFWFATP
jgi:hypothetical protein